MNPYYVIAAAVFVGLLIVPECALAQECRRAGTDVCCSEAGFKTLTSKCAEFQGDAKECKVKLAAAEATSSENKAGWDHCIASMPPPCPPPPVPSKVKPAVGYALGVVGTFVATAFMMSDASTSTKAVAGAAGVVSVVTGVFLTIPLD